MIFYLAQVIAAISFVINVVGMQFNDRKKILLSVVLGGITSITSLCLLGAFSGGWMQIIFTIQAIINYILVKNEKQIPRWLWGGYIIIAIVCSCITFNGFLDILPLVSTVLHTLVILQENESKMRVINLGSVVCWIPYYIVYKAYGMLATACVVFISTLIAICRYDLRGKNE